MTKNILVIDDDTSVISIFDFVLGQVGYDAITVKQINDALPLIKSMSIDLVFMDTKLKKPDSTDHITKLLKENSKLRIIMMSSITVEANILKKAFDNGAYGIIYKPFDIEEVLSIIEDILGKTEINNERDQ